MAELYVFTIFIILLGAYVFSELFKKFKLPIVVAQIIVGFIVACDYIRKNFVDIQSLQIIRVLADLGLIFLLFFVGLSMDIKSFKKTSREAFFVGIFGSLIPLISGFVVGKVIGLENLGAFVLGVCLSITAQAVIIDIMEELKLLRTKISKIIIEAGFIDDFIGIFLIAVVVAYLEAGEDGKLFFGIGKLLVGIMIFALLIYFLRYFILPFIWRFIEKEHSEVSEFMAALIIALFIATLAGYFKLSSIMGAIVAGIIVRQIMIHETKHGLFEEKKITKVIEVITFGLLAPFYFIWVGIQTYNSFLFLAPAIGIIITITGLGSKMLGSIIGHSLNKGKLMEGLIIGTGMNTRGAMELVVAGIALETAIIDINIFSAIVLMTIISTILGPILFEYIVKKRFGRKNRNKK